MAFDPRKEPRPTITIFGLMLLVYALAMLNWLLTPILSIVARTGISGLTRGQLFALVFFNGIVVGYAIFHVLVRWRVKVIYYRKGVEEPQPMTEKYSALKLACFIAAASLTCFVVGLKFGQKDDYRAMYLLFGLCGILSVVSNCAVIKILAPEWKKAASTIDERPNCG
jgi:hypothetical protein